jgi:hypothetical protein
MQQSIKKFINGLKRPRAIAIIALTFLLIATLTTVSFFSGRKIIIAFYGIPESSQISLTRNIEHYLSTEQTRKDPVFITLDGSKSLNDALQGEKRPALVFAYNGKNLDDVLLGNNPFGAKELNAEIFSGMTINIRRISQYDGKNLAVPLLTDHFEAAYSRFWLARAQRKAPETLDSLTSFIAERESAAKQSQKNDASRTVQWDIFFAAADADTMLQITGAYLESAYGVQSCRALAAAIRDGKPFDAILAEPLGDGGQTLASILDVFREWAKKGLLHPQWTTLTLNDVRQFMKSESAPVAFMPFSVHRALDPDIVVNYTASFFPFVNSSIPHSLTAPVICGVRFGKNNVLSDILRYLASQETQATLSMETGLAPVNARTVAPDAEADDVRYWTAATEPPYPGLDKAAFNTPTEREAFAKRIIEYVSVPK